MVRGWFRAQKDVQEILEYPLPLRREFQIPGGGWVATLFVFPEGSQVVCLLPVQPQGHSRCLNRETVL